MSNEGGGQLTDMIAWNKCKAPLRAQHISAVYDRRNDKESSELWNGWRVGNLRPIFEPILWFTKPYPIGTTIADNILKHGVGAYNETALKNYGFDCNNVLSIKANSSDTGLHQTQKPLELINYQPHEWSWFATVQCQRLVPLHLFSFASLLLALNRK